MRQARGASRRHCFRRHISACEQPESNNTLCCFLRGLNAWRWYARSAHAQLRTTARCDTGGPGVIHGLDSHKKLERHILRKSKLWSYRSILQLLQLTSLPPLFYKHTSSIEESDSLGQSVDYTATPSCAALVSDLNEAVAPARHRTIRFTGHSTIILEMISHTN